MNKFKQGDRIRGLGDFVDMRAIIIAVEIGLDDEVFYKIVWFKEDSAQQMRLFEAKVIDAFYEKIS